MMVVKNSLQSQAYNTLKEQILSNILTPGTLYSETRISKELGISRTPYEGSAPVPVPGRLYHYHSQRGFWYAS